MAMRQRDLLSQTLQTATSTTLTLLSVVHIHLQSMKIKTKRPLTLRRSGFGWFELMLEDKSQPRYWKEHFRVRTSFFG